MTGQELARRIRAARELAGYKSADDLAAAIGERGLSGRTLRNLETAKGGYKPPRDLAKIAEVCKLPAGWFDSDLDIAEAIRAALVRAAPDGRQEAAREDAIATAQEEARRRRESRGPVSASDSASDDPVTPP